MSTSVTELTRARLSVVDAGQYLTTDSGVVTDWGTYWVFDNGSVGPPSSSELLAWIDQRQRYLTALRRRVVEVPWDLGNPYWVVDDTPLRDRLVVREGMTDWAAVLDAIAQTVNAPLDPRRAAWRITAYPDVVGAPMGTGNSATVIFAQFSHAALVGAQIQSLSDALFSPRPEQLEIEGAGPPLARARPWANALLGVARLPAELIRMAGMQAGLLFARWRARRSPVPSALAPVPAPDSVPNDFVQAIRVLRPDLTAARGRGITVTELGLAAVSLAIERYLVELAGKRPDYLVAHVAVALADDRRLLGVNRVHSIQIGLFPSIADPAARAGAIHAQLSGTREIAKAALAVGTGASAAVPYALYRRWLRRVLRHRHRPMSPVLEVTSVSSVRTPGNGDRSILGRPYSFGGHQTNLGPALPLGLAHSFVGEGSGLTVTVTAASAVCDVDRYVGLLEAAFSEVAEAMSPPVSERPPRAAQPSR